MPGSIHTVKGLKQAHMNTPPHIQPLTMLPNSCSFPWPLSGLGAVQHLPQNPPLGRRTLERHSCQIRKSAHDCVQRKFLSPKSTVFKANRWGNNGKWQTFIFLGSKITADGDCSHEIKRRLLLGRKPMTNLDSILKSRDITLPTKIHIKAMLFPAVMYGCESWTIKKAEHWRIDAFELWCWRWFLRVPWTARRSNRSILKEISLEYSLEGLMLKLQYLGHLMQRASSLEKTLMLGKIGGRKKRGWQRIRWLDGIINSMDMSLSKLWEIVKDRKAWHAAVQRVRHNLVTEQQQEYSLERSQGQ